MVRYGRVWSHIYMVMCDHVWSYMVLYGQVYSCITIYGCIWSYLFVYAYAYVWSWSFIKRVQRFETQDPNLQMAGS